MRKLPAVIVTILLSSAIFAQSTKEKTKLGFKGGINVSGFRTPTDYPGIKLEIKPGLVLGTFVYIPLSSRFALQPEFLYSQLGSKSRSISQWGGYVTFRYNYFSIPLLVKYKLTKSFYLSAGPEGDILIRAIQKGTPTKNITYNVKDFDFAYTAGIGTSNDQLSFDLRYIHGSQDVSAAPDQTTFYNQAVQATIGVKLHTRAKKGK